MSTASPRICFFDAPIQKIQKYIYNENIPKLKKKIK